jgi:hypothetical protein
VLRFWDTWGMDKSSDIVELRKRIDAMQAAIQPLLTDNKVRNARWEDWKYNLIHATWRERGNKRTFYRMRIVSLTSAITVPSLVGLNLAGAGGVVVRWLTFALSLVAAIAAGILTLYRTGTAGLCIGGSWMTSWQSDTLWLTALAPILRVNKWPGGHSLQPLIER